MEMFEERLSEIERILGVSDYSEVSASDLDVTSILNSLKSNGCSSILKVKIEELRKLKALMTAQSNDQPLVDKINTIQFCEELIKRRVALLEEWDSNIKTVLNSEAIMTTDQHSAALESLETDLDQLLLTYRKEVLELMIFTEDFKQLMNALNQRVEMLENRTKTLCGAEE